MPMLHCRNHHYIQYLLPCLHPWSAPPRPGQETGGGKLCGDSLWPAGAAILLSPGWADLVQLPITPAQSKTHQEHEQDISETNSPQKLTISNLL